MRTLLRDRAVPLLLFLPLAFGGCGNQDDPPPPPAADAAAAGERGVATTLGGGRDELSPEELEAGRHDDGWRRYARPSGDADPRGTGEPGAPEDPGADAATATVDAAAGASADRGEEQWADISPERVNGPMSLPLSGEVAGPSVVKAQVLLNRVGFSPGIIDGRWGMNTEKAVYWFQEARGLSATGELDRATFEALTGVAGGDQVRVHRLTAQDVAGPFVDVPEDIYERAELECLCYESLREKLGEVFHVSPEVLEQLNPGVELAALTEGDELQVPAVEPFHAGALPEGRYTGGDEVRRLVVSGGGFYVHALDEAGDILYHFPSTLGADYSPSPAGTFTVESVTFDPAWHYQPELLSGVDPGDDDAVIPAGPNNDVGVVWMALSEPHYGIHGTKAPETIGYATSSGCVRLTNWDAAFLAERLAEGASVEFRDIEGRDG